LQPGTASDSAKNAADRALLLAHGLEFMGEVGVVTPHAGHWFSLGRRRRRADAARHAPLVDPERLPVCLAQPADVEVRIRGAEIGAAARP
jgi:hypothetical protein